MNSKVPSQLRLVDPPVDRDWHRFDPARVDAARAHLAALRAQLAQRRSARCSSTSATGAQATATHATPSARLDRSVKSAA